MPENRHQREALLEGWQTGSAPTAANPVRLHFCPDGRRAAFVVTDHGDRSKEPIFRAVYFGHSDKTHPDHGQRGFAGRGIALTQGTFWTGWDGYDYLGNPDFLALMHEAHGAGIEICPHNTSENYDLPPEETRADIDRYAEHFGAVNTWIDHNYLPSNLTVDGLKPDSPHYILPDIQRHGCRAAWSYYDAYLNPPTPSLDILAPPSTFAYLRRLASNIAKRLRGGAVDMRRTKSLATYLVQQSVGPKLIGKLVFLRNPNRTGKQRLAAIAAIPVEFFKFWGKRLRGDFRTRFPLRWDEKNRLYWFDTIRLIYFADSLNETALDSLIDGAGICIAHSYLGVNHPSPNARAFVPDGEGYAVAPGLDAFLALLRQRIDDGAVWNPTMAGLSGWMEQLSQVETTRTGDALTLTNRGPEPIKGVTFRTLDDACVTAGEAVSTRREGGEQWFVFDLAPGAGATITASRSNG